MGKAISVLIGAKEYQEIKRYVKMHGFTSISELVRAALSLIVHAQFDDGESQRDAETIRNMFEEYSQSQAWPEIPPKRRRKHSVNDEI